MSPNREVQLHLLRHAHAGDPEKWSGPDEIRPLSSKGRRQAELMAHFLREAGFDPDVVLSSPMTRALETAEIVARAIGRKVIVVEELAGPLELPRVDALLDAVNDPTRPLLVGHDPDFSSLAAELLGLAELPLRKGAILRLDTMRPLRPARAILRWLVPPELLGPAE